MKKLENLERCMRPQFVWDREGLKILQTSEEYEGAKDIARLVFVGIAEMIGFGQSDVMNFLDMEYESYRNKIQTFRANHKESLQRVADNTIYEIDDSIKRFYIKTRLCLNAINSQDTNKFYTIEEWINNTDNE